MKHAGTAKKQDILDIGYYREISENHTVSKEEHWFIDIQKVNGMDTIKSTPTESTTHLVLSLCIGSLMF